METCSYGSQLPGDLKYFLQMCPVSPTATPMSSRGLLPAAQAGSVQRENRAASGWQRGAKSTEQVAGHLHCANVRVEGDLDCSVHQYPCQVATQHQLTYLQAQESHDPSRAWFELLDVLPYIEQETISIEVYPPAPALPCLPRVPLQKRGGSSPLSCPSRLCSQTRSSGAAIAFLGQALQAPHLHR